MAAGTWRTRSLCTRCAARRPRPAANARLTTARRGRGPIGPAGNDGGDLPPPAAPLPPRPVGGPRTPGRLVCPRPQSAHSASDSGARSDFGGTATLWERLRDTVSGTGGGRPQLRPRPGVPWPSDAHGTGAGVPLRRSHVSRAGGAPIQQTLLVSELQCGSSRDREGADTKHKPE